MVNVTLSSIPNNFIPPDKRKKLGLIALATDMTSEVDFARMLPLDQVGIHCTRVKFANPTTPENLRGMAPLLSAAASLILPEIELAAICYSCTAASVVIGDETVTAAIQSSRPGVPVVTPSGAAVQAFAALGVRRISVLTPYLVQTSQPFAAYFENQGLSVQQFHCLGIDDDRDMARVEPETILKAALAADTPQTEAFFISCTALPAIEIIAKLENLTGKPVVTSNQASAWALMKHAGCLPDLSLNKWGRLLNLEFPA